MLSKNFNEFLVVTNDFRNVFVFSNINNTFVMSGLYVDLQPLRSS